jgi:hypothetical protein
MVVARSWALSAISTLRAQWRERNANPVRRHVREWGDAAEAKGGTARPELVVETCFAPLLAWGLSWWEGNQLALALDASMLGPRGHGLGFL